MIRYVFAIVGSFGVASGLQRENVEWILTNLISLNLTLRDAVYLTNYVAIVYFAYRGIKFIIKLSILYEDLIFNKIKNYTERGKKK